MIEHLNQCIRYIEARLEDELDLSQWFKSRQLNDYHFRLVFFNLTGFTLNEYIKKRRLDEANHALRHGHSVTDTAYRFQYQSLDGFTRAFKKEFNYLPSEIKHHPRKKRFEKLFFTITVRKGELMDYKIIEMPAFTFTGISARVPMQFEGVNQAIIELAQSITEDQRIAMRSCMNLEPKRIVNVSYNADEHFLENKGSLTHMIAVLTEAEDIPSLLDTYHVPAASWAVFPNEGSFPEALQSTYAKIASQWLPSSGYEQLNLPQFSFTVMDQEKENHAYSEVWVAVERNE